MTEYRNEFGVLHRLDGPAIENSDGTYEWYLDGKLHRDNAPAVRDLEGTLYYYNYGLLHNDKGPAIIYEDGETIYFEYGKETDYHYIMLAKKFYRRYSLLRSFT